MKKIAIASALCLCSTATYAQSWYLGSAYSRLDTQLDARFVGDLEVEPSALNIFAGYRGGQYFAIEGVLGAGISEDEVERANFDFELKGLVGIAAVGLLPVSEAFDIYGKLGVAYVLYDDSDDDSADARGLMLGVGARFNITEQFGFNVEYVQYPDGEYDDFPIEIETRALNMGGYVMF